MTLVVVGVVVTGVVVTGAIVMGAIESAGHTDHTIASRRPGVRTHLVSPLPNFFIAHCTFQRGPVWPPGQSRPKPGATSFTCSISWEARQRRTWWSPGETFVGTGLGTLPPLLPGGLIMISMHRSLVRVASISVVAVVLAVGCASSDDTTTADTTTADTATADTTVADTTEVATADSAAADDADDVDDADDADDAAASDTEVSAADRTVSTYRIEIWADNWMSVSVDGVLVGEDSVPITTERSFNAETFTFEASLPFTVAIEAKDFKETDSGLEYIGESNQQMGDGGIIAQITDVVTGEVVAVTDADWSALVVHQAPLNPECEDDPDPDSTCEFSIIETPADWTASGFDDSAWGAATEWSAAEVSPKDGYSEIDWVPSAQFIWGADLEIDNTVLLRTTVS